MKEIVLRDITKRFGPKTVLEHVTLSLPRGQVTCLMAPSGSGKTTLMRILLGLLPPDSGTVEGTEGLRMAAVFQEDRLMEGMDALGNILLPSPALSPRTVQAEMAAMGLETQPGQPVRELSGGMRRRVALLRALLSPADLLALDEPFTGLDAETKRTVIQETRRLAAGRTVLFITHDAGEAEAMQGGAKK